MIREVGENRVLPRVTDLVRYATDASPYRLIPQAVVVARDVADVSAVMRFAAREGHTLVFRAGGTSLSGQAQSDDLLVDVRKHWVGTEVLDDGRRVKVRPGTTVGQVNLTLKRYGRVLGPDPASSAVACPRFPSPRPGGAAAAVGGRAGAGLDGAGGAERGSS